jgi:hypothetical protein
MTRGLCSVGLVVAIAVCTIASAHAARPLITDDARIVDSKACQVESWVRQNKSDREFWAIPACNFTGNLETSIGGSLGQDPQGTRTNDVLVQAKTLFRPLETNSYGVGFAMGYIAHPAQRTDRRLLGDLYAYAPISVSLASDRVVVHTNIGATHVRELGVNRATWGVGTEIQVTPRVIAIAETFGQNVGKPQYQAGLRIWLVPNRVQIDTTYGNQFGGSDERRWFSVGVRLLSPAFLP